MKAKIPQAVVVNKINVVDNNYQNMGEGVGGLL